MMLFNKCELYKFLPTLFWGWGFIHQVMADCLCALFFLQTSVSVALFLAIIHKCVFFVPRKDVMAQHIVSDKFEKFRNHISSDFVFRLKKAYKQQRRSHEAAHILGMAVDTSTHGQLLLCSLCLHTSVSFFFAFCIYSKTSALLPTR